MRIYRLWAWLIRICSTWNPQISQFITLCSSFGLPLGWPRKRRPIFLVDGSSPHWVCIAWLRRIEIILEQWIFFEYMFPFIRKAVECVKLIHYQYTHIWYNTICMWKKRRTNSKQNKINLISFRFLLSASFEIIHVFNTLWGLLPGGVQKWLKLI